MHVSQGDKRVTGISLTQRISVFYEYGVWGQLVEAWRNWRVGTEIKGMWGEMNLER
jgi:hypothetical protein